MHDAVQVTHTPGEHVIIITAAEDYYGAVGSYALCWS